MWMSEQQRKYKRDWQRKWRREHPTEARLLYKKYSAVYKKRHPERVKKMVAKAVAKWRKKNSLKNLAHRKVFCALRNGTLEKSPCEICGSLKVDAHHDDYSKPLEVRWLCKKHHGITHTLKHYGEETSPRI